MNNAIIQPNATELEKIVLGVLLIDSSITDKAIFLLGHDSNVFYDPRHRIIYKAILKINSENKAIDFITLIDFLKRHNDLEAVGGSDSIVNLTLNVSSSANLEYHCRIISEKFFKRKMIETCTLLISKAYNEESDVFELLDKVSYETNKIYEVISGQKPVTTIWDLHLELINDIRGETANGVPIPFNKMQQSFMGWQLSDFIIIAARPAMGKSAYAMEVAKFAAKSSCPTLIFSLEMANLQLHKRLVANELLINASAIRKHNLTNNDLEKLTQTNSFDHMPLYFEDSIANLEEIINKSRVAKKEKDIKLIVIDYLQLIEAKGKSEGNEKVSYISRRLKLLAKELNIPVIALSQLSREVEKRADRKPQLSDLRDSGAIEQDADVIQFIYRPEYYGITQWQDEWDSFTNLPTAGEASIITAKHRHCGVSKTRLKWQPEYQKFSDIEDY